MQTKLNSLKLCFYQLWTKWCKRDMWTKKTTHQNFKCHTSQNQLLLNWNIFSQDTLAQIKYCTKSRSISYQAEIIKHWQTERQTYRETDRHTQREWQNKQQYRASRSAKNRNMSGQRWLEVNVDVLIRKSANSSYICYK